ncbi:hypothetical protein J32TS2_09460 [Shouchella clausii]|uniref:hypothetical protein n=1 Tax=Shouchella clausii TaxID=79880 RepID=UPI0007944DE4|nr:hypothetical protein [Shouchella clausii]KKI86912.1 hypothetical protein WZ76_08275 [Shouchella clausii]PAD47528.1 hypothetical protein CHI09_06545 [Shouchella clausii]GIN08863.1 hypothetical protein J1TS1_30080 [Shouchella clausii]GIN15590.1 hypothetical protein J32TS2_09460 [Shouchella clausii]
MNRKRLILLAIVVVLAICISIAFHSWNKAQQEKETANRELRNEYGYAAGSLHLDVDTSQYDQTGDPHDIELTPTDLTYGLLQRWESIAEVIPTIDYPEEAVEKEDWLKVFSTLADNRFEAMDVSKEITKGDEDEATTDSMAILDYLYKGIVYNDYFREFLEDNGIEGPDQRRLE